MDYIENGVLYYKNRIKIAEVLELTHDNLKTILLNNALYTWRHFHFINTTKKELEDLLEDIEIKDIIKFKGLSFDILLYSGEFIILSIYIKSASYEATKIINKKLFDLEVMDH
ncbi:MAG: hypothetical protein ACRCXT_24185 [Paraclostridium sp.]